MGQESPWTYTLLMMKMATRREGVLFYSLPYRMARISESTAEHLHAEKWPKRMVHFKACRVTYVICVSPSFRGLDRHMHARSSIKLSSALISYN
jgi:hypothetical protein